ncbi:hypothetical protein DFH08DRAFT_971258 [Mycena albidolilacea]|uniref:Uncharacterized protein n=1 Tax=Mycena albidolilacea TaxID=1033008 RepID=A0AAD6ZDF2_9AGAR|nr:hypothetical protein DFH08DRAFT_971258 [Mycena albidolilacea]
MIFNYSPGQLTQNVNLMLTFEAPTKKTLSTEQNLVAWKVITMRSVPNSKAKNKATVAYTGRLAFGASQDAIYGSSTVEMKLGESVDLNWQDEDAVWGIPASSGSTGTLIKAKNKTGYKQDISVVEADFHPILKAYVNTGYVQNEFITADISTDMITDWNLAALPLVFNWKFEELAQGGYKITSASSLSMMKEIAPQAYEDLDLSFACTLNWQASVSREVVAAVFAYISSTLAAKGLSYHEEHNDKEGNRKCIASQKGETCEALSAALKSTIFAAIEKEGATIKGKTVAPEDFDLHWTITDEYGVNARGGEDEVISEGSAAWYLLK